jgi:hypothetical protein
MTDHLSPQKWRSNSFVTYLSRQGSNGCSCAKKTTQQMRCHKEGIHDSEDTNITLHCADVEAWQALNRFDPEFAWDPRNVHLGFSTDVFHPYNSDSIVYSC